MPEEEYERRVRDVLMAFRLKLAASRVASPLVEFPALLAFPPDPTPQTCVLFAVAHQESDASMALTFLLPGEVSTTSIPFNTSEQRAVHARASFLANSRSPASLFTSPSRRASSSRSRILLNCGPGLRPSVFRLAPVRDGLTCR